MCALVIGKWANSSFRIVEIMDSKRMGKSSWYGYNGDVMNGVQRDDILTSNILVNSDSAFFNRDGTIRSALDP